MSFLPLRENAHAKSCMPHESMAGQYTSIAATTTASSVMANDGKSSGLASAYSVHRSIWINSRLPVRYEKPFTVPCTFTAPNRTHTHTHILHHSGDTNCVVKWISNQKEEEEKIDREQEQPENLYKRWHTHIHTFAVCSCSFRFMCNESPQRKWPSKLRMLFLQYFYNLKRKKKEKTNNNIPLTDGDSKACWKKKCKEEEENRARV